MDSLNMTNSDQIHEFHKKIKQGKFLYFKRQFSNLVILLVVCQWATNAKFQFNISKGVTLAQLVRASVGQADVQRFEPHLGHNWFELRCVSCKVQALWAPSGTNHKAKLAISLSGWLGRYSNMGYLQSLYLKTPGHLLFQVCEGYNTTLLYFQYLQN